MVVMPLKLRLCMGQIYISCARYLNEPSTSSNPSKHYTVQSSLPFLNKPQTSNLLFYILRSSFARTHVDIVAKEKRIAFCLCPSAHLDYAPCTELCLTLPPSLVRALAQIIKHRLPFSFLSLQSYPVEEQPQTLFVLAQCEASPFFRSRIHSITEQPQWCPHKSIQC